MADASLARWLPSSLTDREVDHNEELKALLIKVWAGLCPASRPMQKAFAVRPRAEGKVIVRMSILTASLGLIMWAMSLAVAAPPKPQTHR